MVSFWMFLHMLGVSIIGFLVVSITFVERMIRSTPDWKQRAILGMYMRRIGMFSPAGTLLVLISGIGNMVAAGYTMSGAFSGTSSWLGIKITLFVLSAVIGSVMSMSMGKKRGAIVMGVMQGGDPAAADKALAATYGTVNAVAVIQTLFYVAILYLVTFKP